MLEHYVKKSLEKKDILLMTHIVLGHRSFEESVILVQKMAEQGVELVELHIPSTEPIVDGPIIAEACQAALERGATVKQCLDCINEIAATVAVPLVVVVYYNIIYRYGEQRFCEQLAAMQSGEYSGVRAILVPDLPPEEGGALLKAAAAVGIDVVFLVSPNTPNDRIQYISRLGGGFTYCLARKGVTGKQTDLTKDIADYLERCRANARNEDGSEIPLAVGLGIASAADVAFLKGKVDIAVVGSQTLRVLQAEGIDGVVKFVSGLRP